MEKRVEESKRRVLPDLQLACYFASRLSAAGNSDNLVAGLLGHSSPTIVHTYAKVLDEYRREAIKKLATYRQEHQAKLEQNTASTNEATTTNLLQ